MKKKDEKENSKTKNAKEEEDMALAIKPNEATIIRKEMFSPSEIEKMKKMCNGENNK